MHLSEIKYMSLKRITVTFFIDSLLIKQQISRVLNHHLSFNSSYQSMEQMAEVINKTPNASIQIPCTKYKIKKSMPAVFSIKKYIKCNQCHNYIGSLKSETQCTQPSCEDILLKTTESDYFVYISIKEQLEKNIENNIDEILTYNSTVSNSSQMIDIQNSDMFKKMQEKYPSYILLPLIVNTDGAKVYKSCSDSLWLIQAYQGYMPPNKRFTPSNILIIAARFGKSKPNMRDFFFPFLKELRDICDSGGLKINHCGQTLYFMPFIFSSCCDLPAKADLLGMVTHSGKFSCSYCFNEGRSVKVENKKTSVIRYLKGNYNLRSHEDFIKAYRLLNLASSTPINGIKTMSCMISAIEFDLVHSFAIDHMHCTELGVMKKILDIWLNSKNHSKPYYIQKKKQILLSKRIVDLKPVSEISRKPRSIFMRGEFKANEFRGMMLYFLRFALTGLHDTKYVRHFQLFSSAMYILLKENLSLDDIELAQIKLNEFVDSFQHLYGEGNVTTNVHLVRHLPNAVKKLGPLWAQSAYGFEANNGVVIKSNTSTKDMIHQLAWKYVMKCSIDSKIDRNIEQFSIGKKKTIKISSTELQLLAAKGIETTSHNFLTIYTDVVIQGTKYKSKQSKEISTIDFFVQLKNNCFGAVCYYVTSDLLLYAVIDMYETIDTCDHILEVKISSNKTIVNVHDISKKLLFLKYGHREYLTAFPNNYEKS